jgi:hypothetical protein
MSHIFKWVTTTSFPTSSGSPSTIILPPLTQNTQCPLSYYLMVTLSLGARKYSRNAAHRTSTRMMCGSYMISKQMHVSVWKYITHTVCLLHISATYVAILREVHYKGKIHRNVKEVSEPKHRYKILHFKNNTCFKCMLPLWQATRHAHARVVICYTYEYTTHQSRTHTFFICILIFNVHFKICNILKFNILYLRNGSKTSVIFQCIYPL